MHVRRSAAVLVLAAAMLPVAGCGTEMAGAKSPGEGSPPTTEPGTPWFDGEAARVLARGDRVRVDEVRAPGSPVRMRIDGRFRVGDARLYVLLDGEPIGRGVPAPDLRSVRVLVPDGERRRIVDGARVSYTYGIGARPTEVGELTVVGR